MAEHDDRGEYNKRMPTKLATPKASGYPNNVANTQTARIRGTGAAQRGTKSSTKLG